MKHVTEILDLVEIHDTDDDREVKAQGLPFRVTVKILGDYEDGLSVIQSADALHAFNIRPSEHLPLPGYVEFSTFALVDAIQGFFASGDKRELDPPYLGQITVSAFQHPEYVWKYISQGYEIRFREDDQLAPARLVLRAGKIAWGGASLEYPCAWKEFEPELAGVQSALDCNLKRLFTWRFSSWLALGKRSQGFPRLTQEYRKLCDDYARHAQAAGKIADRVVRLIERSSLFAHFEQAEASLLYSHGFTWDRTLHRWSWAPPIAHAMSHVFLTGLIQKSVASLLKSDRSGSFL